MVLTKLFQGCLSLLTSFLNPRSLLCECITFAGSNINFGLLGVDLGSPWLQLLLLHLYLVVVNLRLVYTYVR